MLPSIAVTIWNEFRHEQRNEAVRAIYPEGIHRTLADALGKEADFHIRTATLEEPEHGLPEAVTTHTDVLLWWGHLAHDEVSEEVAARVHGRVLEGMGLVVLHSGHESKIFKRLMGTTCSLRWRHATDRERLWNLAPEHPITRGIGATIELPRHEMYGERFDIPDPDELLFLSWFTGGEVFRSGCTWRRGHGRIFYFSPGHETYPIYHHPQIQRVIANGIRWARPTVRLADVSGPVPPLEPLPPG